MKKEDLQDVWKDLDMPSGHAYAKGLRTVKTCVGSEWCRFGTQDSTQMGKDLERGLFKMYAPHKVKLAVSGCPRNCAESGIKDVGVIGVDSGWEIYVGGNGGMDMGPHVSNTSAAAAGNRFSFFNFFKKGLPRLPWSKST